MTPFLPLKPLVLLVSPTKPAKTLSIAIRPFVRSSVRSAADLMVFLQDRGDF